MILIEEAVADVIEQAQNETQVEQMPFEPNSTDDYQYMLAYGESIRDAFITKTKKEDISAYASCALLWIIDIIILYTKKQYNSEITGRLYEYAKKWNNRTLFFLSIMGCIGRQVLIWDDLSINARLKAYSECSQEYR